MSEFKHVLQRASNRDACRAVLYLDLRNVAPKTSQRLRMMTALEQATEEYCLGLIDATSDFNHPKFTTPWAVCPNCNEATCPNRFLFRESHG